MKTKEHFRNLYETAKEEGLFSALMYDLDQTGMRHPAIATTALLAMPMAIGYFVISGIEAGLEGKTIMDTFAQFSDHKDIFLFGASSTLIGIVMGSLSHLKND